MGEYGLFRVGEQESFLDLEDRKNSIDACLAVVGGGDDLHDSPTEHGMSGTDGDCGGCEDHNDSNQNPFAVFPDEDQTLIGWDVVSQQQPRTIEEGKEEDSSNASSAWDVVSRQRMMSLTPPGCAAARSVQSQDSSWVNLGKDEASTNEEPKADFLGVHLDLTKFKSLHRALDGDDDASSMSESSTFTVPNRSVACPHCTMANEPNNSSFCKACGLPLDAPPSLTTANPKDAASLAMEQRDRLLAMKLEEEGRVEDMEKHLQRLQESQQQQRRAGTTKDWQDTFPSTRSIVHHARIQTRILSKVMTTMILPNNNSHPTERQHYRNVASHLPSKSNKFFALRKIFKSVGKPMQLVTAFHHTTLAVQDYQAF